MKIFIETLGCPKNFNDSEYAYGSFFSAGFKKADSISDADVVVVNTCGFIHDAKVESIDAIFDAAQKKKSSAILVVSGCLSQRYMEELKKEMPEVDIFAGVNDYFDLPEICKKRLNDGKSKGAVLTKSPQKNDFPEPRSRAFENVNNNSYTIKISEGCNNKCAFCIIPSIRGSFRSRYIQDIVKEAEFLVTLGAKEIILIGQDVTAFGTDRRNEDTLALLLREVSKIEGEFWIRLMYCYDNKITDELIAEIMRNKKVCKYIDMPIQHISDNVLSAMRRGSDSDLIIERIRALRSNIDDIHIRTTLITGFPGESEEDFNKLYEFVKEQEFDRLGVFSYSEEEGTAAAKCKQIPDEIREQRRDSIMRLQAEISKNKNKMMVGKTMKVLIDGVIEGEQSGSERMLIGRTEFDAPEIDNCVIFKPAICGKDVGEFTYVHITGSSDYDVYGEEVQTP